MKDGFGRDGLRTRKVLVFAHETVDEARPDVDYDAMYSALAGPMPEDGLPPEQVIKEFAATIESRG
jgi:hypothetical protein